MSEKKENTTRPPDPSEIALNEATTRLKIAEAEVAEIAATKAKREESEELAADRHHFVYTFDTQVSDASVKSCIKALTAFARHQPGCDIELRLNSPGGSIIDGFALIDFLNQLRTDGHKITTVAYGWAASMAGVILQAGDVRVMGENAILLIHEGSLGAVGNFGEVEDRVKLMKTLHERILRLFAARSNMSKTAIKRKWARQDWWIPSEEALKLGFVDEVR